MTKSNNNEFIDTEQLELSESTVEQLIVKQLLSPVDGINSIFVSQYFKPSWLKNDRLQIIFSFLLNYWKKYESIPSRELVNKILENDKFKEQKDRLLSIVNKIYDIDETAYNVEFLRDTLVNFTKGRAMYYAILDNIEDIEARGEIGSCLTRFENILKIGLSEDVGIEYFENFDNHLKDLTAKESRNPFLWDSWNKFTYGGIPINEPCLFMIMAQPGLGKSMFMMNIGAHYIQQNKKVLMVTLEMSEQMYSRRMSAIFSDINVNLLKDNTDLLKRRVTTKRLSFPKAKLQIKQYSPSEFNSIKLKSLLKKLKDTKDFVPDLIIVDYLNIMATNVPSYHMKSYERVGTISKELRSVSIETKLPILSATQANRGTSGYAGEEISMNNTSDSTGINMDADAIFALYQLEGERELGRINIKILKNRLGRICRYCVSNECKL